jgi:hypothetical protein
MLLSTLAAMPVPSPMRPSMICGWRRDGRDVSGGVHRRSSGRKGGRKGTTALNLDPQIPGGAPYPTGNGTSATGAGARTHLLGADEVVAEAAGLLLGQHDNLDGLLGEALLERREAGEG